LPFKNIFNLPQQAERIIKPFQMKKAFFMIMVLVGLGATAMSQSKPSFKYSLKESYLGDFSKITVNANVDIVLIQSDSIQKAWVEGDEKMVKQIYFIVKNGELIVEAETAGNYKDRVAITISVRELSALEVNGVADVVSFNTLSSPRLAIKFNKDGAVKIHSSGKVTVEAAEDYTIKRAGK